LSKAKTSMGRCESTQQKLKKRDNNSTLIQLGHVTGGYHQGSVNRPGCTAIEFHVNFLSFLVLNKRFLEHAYETVHLRFQRTSLPDSTCSQYCRAPHHLNLLQLARCIYMCTRTQVGTSMGYSIKRAHQRDTHKISFLLCIQEYAKRGQTY